MVLLAVACSDGDGGGLIAPGAAVWTPSSVALDPTCEGCEVVGELTLDHMHGEESGGAVLMRVPAAVDDEVAQWARCFGGILDCAEPDGAVLADCVAASSCPAACKDHYEALRRGAPDADPFETSWNALEATFTEPTGPCSVAMVPGTLQPPAPSETEVTP